MANAVIGKSKTSVHLEPRCLTVGTTGVIISMSVSGTMLYQNVKERVRMKKLFIIGMLLLPSLVLANEKLEYELKVLGSEYGHASLYFTDTKAYGEIKANKKWSSVYNVNNQIATMVNEKGYPTHTEFTYKFNKSQGHYKIDFEKERVSVSKHTKGITRKRFYKSKTSTHDMISWLAQVRVAVRENPDVPIAFKVFSGARVYDVKCQPQEIEKLQTPIGEKTAKPYRITVTRTRSSLYKREMRIWFNTTSNFEPLRLVGKFKVGHAEAIITSLKSNDKE
jgi:hypothetical protein